jgi:hypothetical protein
MTPRQRHSVLVALVALAVAAFCALRASAGGTSPRPGLLVVAAGALLVAGICAATALPRPGSDDD